MDCTQCNNELTIRDDGMLECEKCKCVFYEFNNKLKKIDIVYNTE